MEVALQIVMQNVPRSAGLEARIRLDAKKLGRIHPHITRCRVAVDESANHHRRGRQFGVRVDVRTPGHGDIVSTLHHDSDVYVAVRDAFSSVRRQLEDATRPAQQRRSAP